jgi:hypothetical protein
MPPEMIRGDWGRDLLQTPSLTWVDGSLYSWRSPRARLALNGGVILGCGLPEPRGRTVCERSTPRGSSEDSE